VVLCRLIVFVFWCLNKEFQYEALYLRGFSVLHFYLTCLSQYLCVCVCVREREREREVMTNS